MTSDPCTALLSGAARVSGEPIVCAGLKIWGMLDAEIASFRSFICLSGEDGLGSPKLNFRSLDAGEIELFAVYLSAVWTPEISFERDSGQAACSNYKA